MGVRYSYNMHMLILKGISVSYNYASALSIVYSTVIISDVQISGNLVEGSCFQFNPSIYTFRNNNAISDGGAIYTLQGTESVQ